MEIIVTFAGFCNVTQCRQAEACRFLNTWLHISEGTSIDGYNLKRIISHTHILFNKKFEDELKAYLSVV